VEREEAQEGALGLLGECDFLYIDSEWSGVGYRAAGNCLPLSIAGQHLDECVIEAVRTLDTISWVVLKLPCNFDRDHVTRILNWEISLQISLLAPVPK
jgi:hypothetical protein